VTDSQRGPVRLEFEFDAAEGGKLDGIRIAVGQPQPGVKPAALTPETRAAAVEGAAAAVDKSYVYPELGAKMAAVLREKLKDGAYADAKDELALASRLTEDLRAVSKDRHLGVRLMPRGDQPDRGPSAEDIAGDNYGFRKVEVLPGNIGYIRFDAFQHAPEA